MPSGFPSAIRAGDAGPPGTRAPQRLVQQRPSAVTHARVWAVALSLAATRAISVDFSSSGYLDVSVPRVASSRPIWFRRGWAGMTPPGFPHSEIRGSKAVCASPRLIAACHVLRRLPVPRHPPCALNIFLPRTFLASAVHENVIPSLLVVPSWNSDDLYHPRSDALRYRSLTMLLSGCRGALRRPGDRVLRRRCQAGP